MLYTTKDRGPCIARALARRLGPAILVAAGVVATALPAVAQEGTDGQQKTPDSKAQSFTPITAGTLTLEPITVTGQKTTRRLRDTATSVSVLSGEELAEEAGTATLSEAISRTPNLITVDTAGIAPTIRGSDTSGPGIGLAPFLGGVRPRVTVQKDGRALTFNQFLYGTTALWDLERVEVLRGPQTTLQGRNSIAGAIIVDTKDPTFYWEGKAQALVGNHDTRQLAGAVSGPITEELALRLSAIRREQETWVDLTGPVGTPDPLEDNFTDIRGKLLYLPKALPEFSAKLTLERVVSHGPQVEIVTRPFDKRERDAAFGFPVYETESNSAIVDLNYSLTPNWELRNTSVYTDGAAERFAAPGRGNVRFDSTQYSNELLANYQSPDGDTELVLGTYGFHSETTQTFDFLGSSLFDDETDAAAVFGQGSLTFFDVLELTLGARYQHVRRERSSTPGSPFPINFEETYTAFLPKVGLSYRASEDLTYGVTVQRGYSPGGAGISLPRRRPSAPPIPPMPYSYGEEFVWNYEAFFRSTWLENRLRLNGNIFYSEYDGLQRTTFLNPGDPFSAVIRNAEAAAKYGAELMTTWLPPVTGLELYGSLGLLHTELERFDAATREVEGNEFARAPNVTLTVGFRYKHPSGWSLGARGRYVDGYFSDDANTPAMRIDSYTLVDVDASYQFNAHTRVFAYVDNVFNSDADIARFFNNTQAALVDPREFGIGIEYTFGQR